MNLFLAYRSTPELPRALLWTVLVIRLLLIAFFTMMAVKNLAGNQQISDDFARWGYPDWFRIATAFLQLAGAWLLLFPATAFYGAALLVCILLGAIVTHLRFDPLPALASPAVFLLLVGTILATFRPPMLRWH